MVKLTEIYQESMSTKIGVREVYINPNHVVMVREDMNFGRYLQEGKLNDLGRELVNPAMRFTRISVRNSGTGNYEIVVFGDTETVYEKIRSTQKSLLKG
jgi:hypothetical protein